LSTHRAVNYLSSATGKPVPLEFSVDGRETATYLPSAVSVTGADLYTGSAVAGLGIVQVPHYRVARELAAGQLKIILADFPPPPMPVSVLYPQNRQLSHMARAAMVA
jgi:DNA-binding transcriptional LysR family regulator